MASHHQEPRKFGPYKLTPLWEARGQRISWGRAEDGSISLVHSTDYDSGGSRGLVIPAEAVAIVGSAMFGESLRRSCAAITERLQRAIEQARDFKPPLSMAEDAPETIAHVPDAYPPSSVDMGRGCEP